MFSRITSISLIISSFFGCCDRFICLIATSMPVDVSSAVYTVPDALQFTICHAKQSYKGSFTYTFTYNTIQYNGLFTINLLTEPHPK